MLNNSLVEKLWAEIEQKYSTKKRHYHTLVHLENLNKHLRGVKSDIEDWDTIVFTLFYHDIVYNTLKSDNEEKSAGLAGKRLIEINLPGDKIASCIRQILATKTHLVSIENDTNLFTDADLSILGQPPETYKTYCKEIRKEYAIYPDVIYNPGRKKVLAHFLQMERIFKTKPFYDAFEKQARINIVYEMNTLNT